MFGHNWFNNDPNVNLFQEIGFTEAGVYVDPNGGNGTWTWQSKEDNVMDVDRAGKWEQKFYQITETTIRFKIRTSNNSSYAWEDLNMIKYDSEKK